MTATLKPRITTENRTRLETVIPLSTPYLVFLDPSDLCNFQCRFCPTGDRELIRSVRRSQLMDFGLYQKIIDDLASMPKPIKTLRLYADGEPLLNSRLPDMIKYAKQAGRFLQIDTTTNGSFLYANKNRRLIEAGLDKIFISINGLCDEDYWQFCRTRLRFGRMVKAIRHFYKYRGNCKVHIKISGDHLSDEKKAEFIEVFGNISDSISIEHTANCWPGFEVEGVNNELGIYGQPLQQVKVCPYIFYSLKINSDGTVSLCFLDWKHKMILGDLKTKTFSEIWNGNELKNTRRLFLDMQRKGFLAPVECRNCGQLAYGAPDDIDQYAQEILGRLS
jgi:MoaA/NifB/PqqE/SkfB family radical SAM enzyme